MRCCVSPAEKAIKEREKPLKRLVRENGITEMDPEDPEVEAIKWSALKEINAKSCDLLNYIPVQVLSASQQEVSGILYRLEIEVAQSTALKRLVNHDQLKKNTCDRKKDGKRFVYSVKIWSKPEENFEEVVIQKVRKVKLTSAR
ncbi:hypothetical protein L596_028564 [Steinernema carpocapsae]|uniref:Cystatin domain-containing protein n=1 Tax=Steinernema carpocapsae TaxID=34508 RepID=A0A4U5LYV0_STECR|nr:hypothetical protein L596_028564 [Steinernema carpocapsae]